MVVITRCNFDLEGIAIGEMAVVEVRGSLKNYIVSRTNNVYAEQTSLRNDQVQKWHPAGHGMWGEKYFYPINFDPDRFVNLGPGLSSRKMTTIFVRAMRSSNLRRNSAVDERMSFVTMKRTLSWSVYLFMTIQT